MLQDIAAILETCLEEITAGRATVQECLDQYPDLVGELEPLLRAAERAQTIDRPSLAPEARTRIEARLLAAAKSIPSVQPVRSPHPTIALTWRWAAIRLVLLCACACFLGTGLITAASGALPDSPLYPVKLTTEEVWLWLAAAQDEPALHLRFAQRRLDEAQALVECERFDTIVLTALTEETAAALAGVETLPPEAAGPVLQEVLRVTAEQERVLSALMTGAPALERGEFVRTLQASRAHRVCALQLMGTVRPPGEPGKPGQATSSPVPTPLARTATLPSRTPEPSGTPAPSSTPTTTDGSEALTEVPQPTATVKLATTPGPTAMVQPTGSPEPTGVLVPTRTPTATPKPGATVGPTETPRPTETVEPTGTSIPPAATATTVPSTTTPESQGCVYSFGYWKNHPDVWTVDSLILGHETYLQAELLDLLNEPTSSDASLILAQQLIAARLNVANGADNSTIAATIAAAKTWLANYAGRLPYDVSPSLPEGQEAVALANTLGQYNNGGLPGGPPDCPR